MIYITEFHYHVAIGRLFAALRVTGDMGNR